MTRIPKAGYSWIAVQATLEEVKERLWFVPTGKTVSPRKSAMAFAEMPGGWVVVYSNNHRWAIPGRAGMADNGISLSGAVCVRVQPRGRRASVELYRVTGLVWGITQDVRLDDSLIVEGAPSSEMRAAIAQLEKGGGDGGGSPSLAPVELASRICGFDPLSEHLWTSGVFRSAKLGPTDNFFLTMLGLVAFLVLIMLEPLVSWTGWEPMRLLKSVREKEDQERAKQRSGRAREDQG